MAKSASKQLIGEAKPNLYIIKDRIPKSYRLQEIDDKIRKLRTRSEGKLLEKASKIVNIPKLIKVDETTKEISMEFINGKKLSASLDEFSLELQKKILKQIGVDVGKLHDSGIIHGDLTTSNMIYVQDHSSKLNISYNSKNVSPSIKNLSGLKSSEQRRLAKPASEFNDKRAKASESFKVYFIDFGLGFQSIKVEDKAVDLHLLKQSLEAKHFKHWEILFNDFLKGYSKSKEEDKILQRLKIVEKRGRYKERY